jgi:hypothetical protein
MVTGNPYRPSYGANDWTARLPPGSPSADPGMIAQPYADPGYGMPNAYVGNLNQAPGLVVGGALRANALQITDPNADSDNPLANAPSWADAMGATGSAISGGVDRLGQWLAEQRAKSAKMGLWNDQTGLPTGAGLVSAAGQYGNALMMGTTAPKGATSSLPIYRGQYRGTEPSGNFFSEDHEFAKQFTRSGLDEQVITRHIDPAAIYHPPEPVYAGDEEAVDAAIAEAKRQGLRAVRLSEARGSAPGEKEPASLFVFDKGALSRRPSQ